MKLHTSLSLADVRAAMNAAKDASLVARDVMFAQLDYENSRTHAHGYKIQLGTYDKTSGPTKSRHYKNSGNYGAASAWNGDAVWSATWDEWGWFIAQIFTRDPGAKFGHYASAADFHAKTDRKFAQVTPAMLSHAPE